MTAEIPEYPMKRAAGCPFDPPPGLKALAGEGPLHKVKLWNGMTPWLITRHADQRELMRDLRISADGSHPSYPAPPASSASRTTSPSTASSSSLSPGKGVTW